MSKIILRTKAVAFLSLTLLAWYPRIGWGEPERRLLGDDGDSPGEARILPTPSGKLLGGDDDDSLPPELPPEPRRLPTALAVATAAAVAPELADTPEVVSGTPAPLLGTSGGFDMKNPVSRAQYKVMLAVVDYKKKPSDVLYQQVVVAMERRVQIACMSSVMKDLDYKGPPDTDQCQEAIAQLRAVNPESTSVACAVHGIASRSCQSAEASTKSVLVSMSDLDRDLVAKIGLYMERNGQRITQSGKNYKEILRVLASAKPDALDLAELKQKEKELQQEYLKVACNETLAQLRVVARPAVIVRPASQDPYGLRQMVEKHQKKGDEAPTPPAAVGEVPFPEAPSFASKESSGAEKTAPAPTAPEGIIPRAKEPLVLVRAIPRSCFEAVREVYRYNPQSPMALCAEFGGFSSKCILGLKKFRAEQSQTPARSSSSGSDKAFSEF
jgi:hypothetical protein